MLQAERHCPAFRHRKIYENCEHVLGLYLKPTWTLGLQTTVLQQASSNIHSKMCIVKSEMLSRSEK